MNHEQATFMQQAALPSITREMAITQKVLDAVPADKGEYRPDPVGMSAFELAWHIASADNMFLSGVVAGGFDFGFKRPDSIKTPADVAAWYGEQSKKNLQALTAMTGEQCARIIDFRGMFQLPAIAFAQFAMSHEIHHRGQLSMYLRPMGAKVPAIYGESYDSKQAKQAAG
jgi:uncharacterized damage-inducible protein DinB